MTNKAVRSVFLILILSFFSIPSAYAQKNVLPWGSCLDADIWVLFDYSGSMNGYENYVTNAMEEIAKGVLSGNPYSKIGIISFSARAYLVQGLSDDLQSTLDRIHTFKGRSAYGSTNIGSALNLAQSNEGKTSDPSRNKMILLISDGDDYDHRFELQDISTKLKTIFQWSIYSIMLNKRGNSKSDHFLARSPQGINFPVEYPEHDDFPVRFMVKKPATREQKYNLLKMISGDPVHSSDYFVDTVELENLAKYFHLHFVCS